MSLTPSLGSPARTNRKLTPTIYRAMRGKTKNNPLFAIPDQFKGQVLFKKAYHSEKTPDELRALLLNIAFSDRTDLFNTLSMYQPKLFAPKKGIPVAITIREENGEHYLDFVQYGNQVKFNPKTKKALKSLIQAASPHSTVIKALNTEDQQGVYIAQWKNELFVALYALADLLRNLVKVNDIWNILYNYDDEDGEEADTGLSKLDYNRALEDLRHMRRQIPKFEPIALKIGVRFNLLYHRLDFFILELEKLSVAKFNNVDQEVETQYHLFERIPPITEEIGDIIYRVSISLKEDFPKRFKIPKFVDYNSDRSLIHREKVNITKFQNEIEWITSHFREKLGNYFNDVD